MRTRWLAVPLAAAVLVAGCGGDNGEEGEGPGDKTVPTAGAGKAENCPVDALAAAKGQVEVNVWYAFQGVAAKGIEKLAADYNASQDKVVVKVANQGSYEEQLGKYKTALAKPDSLPEMVTAEDTNARFILDSNSVVTAEDCLAADPDAKDLYDDLVPAVRAAYSIDDKLQPVAFGGSNPVLYFKQAHFRAAGIDTTKPPSTLDELRAAAEKLKAANIAGLEQPLVLKMDSWFLEHWLTGQGEAVVDKDNGRGGIPTKALLESDAALEVVNWIKKMVDDGLVKAVRSNDDISSYLAVATQSGSMLIETSAAITTIDAAIAGTLDPSMLPGVDIDVSGIKFDTLEVGVALLPGKAQAGKGQIGGNAWYIPKKKPEEIAAAWDFAKYVNSREAQVGWTLTSGYLPSHQDAADDPTLVEDWTKTRKGGWSKIAYQGTLSLDPDFTGPLIGAYAAFRTEARAALDAIAFEGADPAARLKEADERIATAFAAYAQNPGQS